MTSLAAMRAALADARAAVTDTAHATRGDFALWPPAPALCGPHAARQAAQALADTGAHSHLVTEGETVCLTGTCPTHPVLDGVPSTPREVLL